MSFLLAQSLLVHLTRSLDHTVSATNYSSIENSSSRANHQIMLHNRTAILQRSILLITTSDISIPRRADRLGTLRQDISPTPSVARTLRLISTALTSFLIARRNIHVLQAAFQNPVHRLRLRSVWVMPSIKDPNESKVLSLSCDTTDVNAVDNHLCISTLLELFLPREGDGLGDSFRTEPVAAVITVAVYKHDFLAPQKQVFDVRLVATDTVSSLRKGSIGVAPHRIREGREIQWNAERRLDPFAIEERRDVGVGIGFRLEVRDVEGAAMECVGVGGVRDVAASLHVRKAGEEGDIADVVDDLVRAEELRVQEGGVSSTRIDEVFAALARSCECVYTVGVVLLRDEGEVRVVQQVERVEWLLDEGVNTAVQETEGINIED